jgi:hypothetical protein
VALKFCSLLVFTLQSLYSVCFTTGCILAFPVTILRFQSVKLSFSNGCPQYMKETFVCAAQASGSLKFQRETVVLVNIIVVFGS